MKFIVTYKLKRDTKHNPQNKIVGPCPFTNKLCTDTTGEHHSELVEAADIGEARRLAQAFGEHVTRIEEA